MFDKVIRFYPIFDLSNNKKQPIMKTFIIYLTSFAGLENEYETRYEVVADCIGNALNYAKGQHKHNVSEYDY